MALAAGGVLWGGTAWAAPAPAPALTFNSVAQEVELTIPSPPCPPSESACQWMLYVNEPGVNGQPTISEVIGTSGTLTVPYPPDFCGVIQADALIGPGAWAYQTGERTSIATCPQPDVVATTAPATTAPSSGDVAIPASVGAVQPTTLPFSDVAATYASDGPVAGAATSLPFTGVDIGPLVLVGLASVLGGALLMSEPGFGWLRRLAHAGPTRWVASLLGWLTGC
jgi:hypothetical protein